MQKEGREGGREREREGGKEREGERGSKCMRYTLIINKTSIVSLIHTLHYDDHVDLPGCGFLGLQAISSDNIRMMLLQKKERN